MGRVLRRAARAFGSRLPARLWHGREICSASSARRIATAPAHAAVRLRPGSRGFAGAPIDHPRRRLAGRVAFAPGHVRTLPWPADRRSPARLLPCSRFLIGQASAQAQSRLPDARHRCRVVGRLERRVPVGQLAAQLHRRRLAPARWHRRRAAARDGRISGHIVPAFTANTPALSWASEVEICPTWAASRSRLGIWAQWHLYGPRRCWLAPGQTERPAPWLDRGARPGHGAPRG